ncbi:epoxide hydrolase family protein [Pseudofrankia asymbiotica]|uniref:Epoxide hydrolase n=1 Tax=Pseudofrankia asymbiotica TaxID=1834516 RepID=A0A1V2IEN2_9ACTN|nr:epoxide hydrolase family protein [Pseudofrankia asymbiotica]ONH31662.1 epoxide hydrolase [Pseudofrankia asymbiotica]
MEFTPFEVHVDDAVIDDLRWRLRRTRWPDQIPGSGWDYGTDGTYLRELCAYWADEFDWRAVETRINAWPQFTTEIDGQRVHFIHARSPYPKARPLLMVHGWPSTPLEFLRTLGPLTDPVAHGGDETDAFHVVAPSIPGYGWSGPTAGRGWHPGRIAAAFGELMDGLGYDRFAAFGTDMGSPINTELARRSPGLLIGLHLTLLQSGLRPLDGVLTPEEEAMVAANDRRRGDELGYVAIQSTRPQTLSYGLTDSPAGQAAWIVEKLRSWTDCDGDLESVLSRDEILATVMTYWVTATAGSSARLYYEMARYFAGTSTRPAGSGRVEVPTGVAVFPKELYPTTERIANDHFAIEHWNLMPRGGHFAAAEEPGLLVDDLRAFFRGRA